MSKKRTKRHGLKSFLMVALVEKFCAFLIFNLQLWRVFYCFIYTKVSGFCFLDLKSIFCPFDSSLIVNKWHRIYKTANVKTSKKRVFRRCDRSMPTPTIPIPLPDTRRGRRHWHATASITIRPQILQPRKRLRIISFRYILTSNQI